MGRSIYTQVECILDSSVNPDDFLAVLEEIVTSQELEEAVEDSDWDKLKTLNFDGLDLNSLGFDTFGIFGLEQNLNRIRWFSDGYGCYNALLGILSKRYPKSLFAQLWIPSELSNFSDWGWGIDHYNIEPHSSGVICHYRYPDYAADEFDDVGFVVVEELLTAETKKIEDFPRLYKFLNFAKDKGFSFPKFEDFDDWDTVVWNTYPYTEIITYGTLSDILKFLGYDEFCNVFDLGLIELEFCILSLYQTGGFYFFPDSIEFTPKTFISSTSMVWQPWSPINYDIPSKYLSLLAEKFPEDNRIESIIIYEDGAPCTLFYDMTQATFGLRHDGEHVATYNHETGNFYQFF